MFPLNVPVKTDDDVEEIKKRLKNNSLHDAKVTDVNNGSARVVFPNRKQGAMGKVILSDFFPQ